VTRRSSGTPEISVHDRMCWPAGELERALRSGTHRRELVAYLGESEYALLRSLERAGARARRRASFPTVYLLPGIMGSQLGHWRDHGQAADLLWLDPSDIVRGRLAELRWGADKALETLGGIVYSYLALKLRLQAAGFEVVLHDYDWRQDLRILGAQLAARLRADTSGQLALVGHSMGGLLARAALAHWEGDPDGARITRVIGLGTPHGGSMAAVQTLRATYPVVCRLAAIDRKHNAEELSRKVFGTFKSVYQLLPADSGTLDLFDPRSWPQRGVRPDAALLAAARALGAQLAPADARFASIIGTGQRTVTGIERRGGQFHYEISAAGDGTVSAVRATLPGARNYYLRCEHGELPRSELVSRALVDLLRAGRTRRLAQQVILSRGRYAYVSDAGLRRSFARKIDWHSLRTAERRRYFARLNAPPPLYWPSPR
jgi:pimeloyl-ACP methyl ester carboxylesterase